MKSEFLEWLLKTRGKYSPYIIYRGGAMRAILNLEIPLDEVSDFFQVKEITIKGEVWRKVK